MIGNLRLGSGPRQSASFDQAFVLRYEGDEQPAAGVRYRLVLDSGRVIEGVTDSNGHTALAQSDAAELTHLELFEG
jgi:type VI secretion system secreted protein VgrG